MAARNKKPNELYLTRVYDAPVKLVWDAWCDPAQAAKWWGPRGFTITTHSKDLRPGGHWSYTMHGPDGTDYENKTIYHVVEKHAKLVYDHGGNDDRPPLFRVTVTFEEIGKGKTKMDMTMTLATAEVAAQTKKFIKKAGGDSTWDRLGEFLAQQTEHKNRFIINRAFNAPIETVFKMWADPEHLARWLAPTGFTMTLKEGAINAGSTLSYSMSNGTDVTMHGRVNYLEITPPSRLVYTQQFCDEHGGISRHPSLPVWPETMLTHVAFEAEDENTTRVTVTWEPCGSATAEELAVFTKMKPSMTQGWTGSFDKLEAVIEDRSS